MRPALAGSTPFPRGPHSVGVSPGWASSSALVGWPSPELLPQCPPCFPPGPVPCIRWVGCGQAPMANLSPPSAGVHRHTCVVCMGQHDLVLARFPTGTRSLGGGERELSFSTSWCCWCCRWCEWCCSCRGCAVVSGRRSTFISQHEHLLHTAVPEALLRKIWVFGSPVPALVLVGASRGRAPSVPCA